MMKTFTLSLFMLLSLGLSAQLASGSIAPNFTTTDLDGETYTLYDILDEGKIVIIDLYAVWCGPCWSYHQTHALEDAWQQLGPDGTDELFVMGIEADQNTSPLCITDEDGCSSYTYGNWREGISYPMIDDADVGDAYALAYYPTVYMIYPNRIVTEIRQQQLPSIMNFMSQAMPLEEGLNPQVISFNGHDGSICSNEWITGQTYFVSNMGDETITEMTYEIRDNGEVVKEETWTGEAAPYSIITEAQMNPQQESSNTLYEFVVTSVNGSNVDNTLHQSNITFQTENTIAVHVETDVLSEEDANRYEILDQDGNIMASNDVNVNNQTFDFLHDLPSQGCYSFVFYDDGFNGMSGVIRVTDIYGNVIYNNHGFRGEAGNDFFVDQVTNTLEVLETPVTIAPNPTDDVLNIEVSDQTKFTKINIVDVNGKLINSSPFSNSLDVSQLNAGNYLLQLVGDQGVSIKRFIKQ